MGLEIYSDMPVHLAMRSDKVRNRAYRRAIDRMVRPDSVVLDVGAGTGLLAEYAAKAGCRRVYAIEQSPVAAIARRTASRYGGRMQVVAASVAAVELPEPVDLLVSEWMGAFGVDENLLPMVLQARDRWLAPGGRIVPERVTAWIAPVEGAAARTVALPATAATGRRALRWAAAGLPDRARLAERRPLWRTDLQTFAASNAELPFRGRAGWRAARAGRLDGFVAWFEADFPDGSMLCNAPGAPPTHWGQFVFAVDPPLAVRAGTPIGVGVTTIPAAPGYCHHAWSVQVDDRPWQHHDTRGVAAIETPPAMPR